MLIRAIFGAENLNRLNDKTKRTPSTQKITKREKLLLMIVLSTSVSWGLSKIKIDHARARAGKIIEECNFTAFHSLEIIVIPPRL